MTEDQKEYVKLYEQMCKLCERMGLGDPFSYARGKEIYMAFLLGHIVADTLAGPDAIETGVGKVEYKSTTQANIQGAYTGISCFPTWEEVLQYLKTEKIGCYRHHFFARFSGGRIAEAARMSGDDVLRLLITKVQHSFETLDKRKDKRLSGRITKDEIREFGTRLI